MGLILSVLASLAWSFRGDTAPQCAYCTPSHPLHATSSPSLLSYLGTRSPSIPAHVSLPCQHPPWSRPVEVERGPPIAGVLVLGVAVRAARDYPQAPEDRVTWGILTWKAMLSIPLPVPRAKKADPPASCSLPAPAGAWLWGTCVYSYPRLFPPWTRHEAAAASGKKASGEDEVLLGGQPRSQQPSFLWALLATFGPSILISMCFKVVQDLLSFINPQLLRSDYSLHRPPLGGGCSWLAGCP